MSFFQLKSPYNNNKLNQPGAPTVTTSDGTNILNTQFDANGYVWEDNNSTITERGFCYSSVSSVPTTADDTEVVAGTIGSLSATIDGLSEDTLYYFRAYAINAYGTGYGEVFTVTTTTGEVTVLAAPMAMMMGMGT